MDFTSAGAAFAEMGAEGEGTIDGRGGDTGTGRGGRIRSIGEPGGGGCC